MNNHHVYSLQNSWKTSWRCFGFSFLPPKHLHSLLLPIKATYLVPFRFARTKDDIFSFRIAKSISIYDIYIFGYKVSETRSLYHESDVLGRVVISLTKATSNSPNSCYIRLARLQLKSDSILNLIPCKPSKLSHPNCRVIRLNGNKQSRWEFVTVRRC